MLLKVIGKRKTNTVFLPYFYICFLFLKKNSRAFLIIPVVQTYTQHKICLQEYTEQ